MARAQKQPGGCFAVVAVVVAAGLFQLFGGGQSDLDASTPDEPEPVAVVVPDLTGVSFEDADAQLRALGHREDGYDGEPRHHDYSAVSRHPGYQEAWTVVTTRPAAGQRWDVGEPIYLFSLKTVEWQWFAAHPVMPDVPVGIPAVDVTAAGQVLQDVADLVEYRYAPGHEPEYPSPAPSPSPPLTDVADDPSVEPPAERAALDALPWASEFSSAPAVASIPAEKAALRLGQRLVVTIGDEPRSGGSGGGSGGASGGYGYGSGDDDDSFNVPGWACPTRWC